MIGDVPSWRVDHMPYGGVKESGLGREGVKFAIEDMTELRLLVIRTRDLNLSRSESIEAIRFYSGSTVPRARPA